MIGIRGIDFISSIILKIKFNLNWNFLRIEEKMSNDKENYILITSIDTERVRTVLKLKWCQIFYLNFYHLVWSLFEKSSKAKSSRWVIFFNFFCRLNHFDFRKFFSFLRYNTYKIGNKKVKKLKIGPDITHKIEVILLYLVDFNARFYFLTNYIFKKLLDKPTALEKESRNLNDDLYDLLSIPTTQEKLDLERFKSVKSKLFSFRSNFPQLVYSKTVQ